MSWEKFTSITARFFPSIRILHPLRCHRFDARMADLKQTLDDYVTQVRELLDFRHERRQVETCATAPEPRRQPKTTSALVIAGRGVLDQAAAELAADAIHFRLGIPVQCPSLGGLTGIGAVADSAREGRSEFVVLISVGEVTPTQLDLLLSRIRRVFITSTILLGDWAGRPMSSRPAKRTLRAQRPLPRWSTRLVGSRPNALPISHHSSNRFDAQTSAHPCAALGRPPTLPPHARAPALRGGQVLSTPSTPKRRVVITLDSLIPSVTSEVIRTTGN
jgi:hypothetical protein